MASKLVTPEVVAEAKHLHHSQSVEQSSSLSTSDLLELPAA